MKPAPAGSLLEYLQQIPDPRGRQGLRHDLKAMLATVVCALLQGAHGYWAIAQWIHAQDVTLWHELGYHRRPPKLGAFRKLLMAIPSGQLEAAIQQWVCHCLGNPQPAKALEPVAIDGKALRGTLKGLERVLHLLSVLDHATGCTLSQNRVEDHTNEAKSALQLLRGLVLKGRVVTGDAMFCQREICQQILHQGGHYFFALKDNQPTLKEAVTADFQAAFSPDERTPAACAS